MAQPLVLLPGSGGVGAAGNGTSRLAARRDIADELGEYWYGTTVSTPSFAVTPDAGRQVLATRLGADQKSVSRFDGFWLYVADGDEAGEIRQVLSGTYDGPIMSLLVDRPFTTPLASGTAIELSSPLPIARHLSIKGIHECMNEGLERIVIDTRLALTGTGSRSMSLADYPYIVMGDQVDSIWTRWSSDQPYERSWNVGRVDADGVDLSLVLDTAIASGEAFQARVIRRADTLIRSGGTWTASTVGLAADDDEAAVPLHWLRAFALVKCLRACITMTRRDRTMDPAEKRDAILDYESRLRTWAQAAVLIIRDDFPQLTQDRGRGLVTGLTTSDGIGELVSTWP